MKDEQSDAIHEALLPAEPIGDDDQQQSRDCSLDDNKQTQSSHGITRHDQYDPSIPPVLITKNYGNVEVLHQARYAPSFCVCGHWDYQRGRKYFYVLENGFEVNQPYVFPTFLEWISLNWFCCCNVDGLVTCCFQRGLCCWIPPNSCCPSIDSITKIYFDRGFYDRQCFLYHGLCGNEPVFTGPPTIYYGPRRYVCFCMDCPAAFNECASCNIPVICGETVSVRPCSEVFGCPLEATWCCNCCGLFGIKDGDPICVQEISGGSCLAEGESIKLADALNKSHAAWSDRKRS